MQSIWPVSRRPRGLLGLVASILVGAGAIAAWLAWPVASAVELAPPARPATPVGSPDAASQTAPAPQAPVAAATPGGHRPAVAQVITGAAGSPPVTLVIPAIGVNARVVPEGVDSGGALGIPPPAQVGWYDRGPGQSGTTLLAGHIDDDGVPGALLHLNDVQLGDAVRVRTAPGRVAAYTVTRRQLLPQHELALSGLLSDQGAPALVLVSCGGAYDAATHLYLDNIVVVATPVR